MSANKVGVQQNLPTETKESERERESQHPNCVGRNKNRRKKEEEEKETFALLITVAFSEDEATQGSQALVAGCWLLLSLLSLLSITKGKKGGPCGCRFMSSRLRVACAVQSKGGEGAESRPKLHDGELGTALTTR